MGSRYPVTSFEGPFPMRSTLTALPGGPVALVPRASIGQPKISRPAFEDLEFDGGWPNLLRASYMIENSTVARLAVAWLVGAFTPLELRAQIIVGEFLLGDDVAEFLSGNMNNTFLHPEHLVGIMIQSLRLQKSIEVFEIDALK